MKHTYSSWLTRWLPRPLAALGLGLATAGAAHAQTPSFSPMAAYPTTGSRGYFVATGDLNGDGTLDLVSANSFSSNVSVLLGRAAGGFSAAVTYAVPDSPEEITLVDVNRDGKLDAVLAATGGVVVLLGTGDGTLGKASVYSSGNSLINFNLKLYDVTRDGILDAVVSSISNTVSVLPGTASGTFGPATVYSVGSSVRSLNVADFNHDGRADIVVSDANLNDLYVLLGRDSGFAAPVAYATGRTNYDLTTADLNRDGQLDIIIGGNTTQSVGVLSGNANGTFNAIVSYLVNATSSYLSGITTGDVNGDGYLDVVVNDAYRAKTIVLPGSSTGALGAASTFSAGDFAFDVTLADINRDGKLDIVVANGGDAANTLGVLLNTTYAVPTLTSLSPTSGPVGRSVTLTGTNLTGATAVSFNGTAATTFSVVNATTVTATVPTGATTGNVTVTTPGGTTGGLLFAVTYPDLVVSTTTAIPAGIYNSITLTSTGTGTLAGNVTVNTSLTVQSGGTLNDGCFVLSGAGSFTLAAGGTLGICNAAGISSSGATGAVQVTGPRAFSTDASYVYNGTATQGTGNGLPAQVRNLSTTNANNVTLTSPTSATQVVTVGGAGNLVLNGNALTLLSTSAGTALVVNSGAGIVSGNTAVVQRYIDGSLNGGPGYRHFGVPVTGSTIADFSTSSFTPVLNPAYNSSPTPAAVTPFPTFYIYNQSALPARTNNLPAFDKGWLSPTSLTDGILPGLGYCVNISAGQVVDFVGSLYNTPLTVGMSRTTGATAADGGWALLGNPYPAPLNLAAVDASDRVNLEAAAYVYSSTSQYSGRYRTYINGIGNPVIPLGQGFFARVASGQTSGSFTFRNRQRLTAPDNTPFQRTAADPRPLVQLTLKAAGSPDVADEFYAYAESGATPAFDSQFDAVKLPNSTGFNLAGVAATGEPLAVDARATFTATTVLPLTVGVPAAGAYSLGTTALANLPAGLTAYLRDAQTGQTTQLMAGTSYNFSVSAVQAQALVLGRFAVVFSPQTTLATISALSAEAVSVYPNPAHSSFAVTMPGVMGASAVQAELVNTLGQVVRRQSAGLPASGTSFSVPTAELAAGVYVLRLQAGDTTLTKRVVVQ